MRIWRFVITGGPCAGKTTCLSILEQSLTQKGFKVIVVSETATELINSGITPWELNSETFQSLLIDLSINKEDTACTAAFSFKKDVVILFDRGLLDCKAYVSQDAFNEILRQRNTTENEILNSYDGVFHLVTAAKGAEEFYTLANNTARKETPEQAIELDDKTQSAWIGHPNFRVIDNSTDFKNKIDRLLNEVYSIIGLPIATHVQKKFLIKKPTEKVFSSIRGLHKVEIFQTYLHSKDERVERRIRQIGSDGNYTFYYTEKKELSNSRISKNERKISHQEYISLLMNGEKSIRKTRYYFLSKNQYFYLDIYSDWKDKAILEIDLTYENKSVFIPHWIDVIQDVTDIPNFKNRNLAH